MIFGADIGIANLTAMDNDECKNLFLNVGTGKQTSVVDLLNLIKYQMDFLIDLSEVRFLYEDHDPNLVKERCADVTQMHKYLGSHNISVDEGIALTCKELYAKATDWQSHNG